VRKLILSSILYWYYVGNFTVSDFISYFLIIENCLTQTVKCNSHIGKWASATYFRVQKVIFFSSWALTQAEESHAPPIKSGRPVMHKFVSRLRCIENTLYYPLKKYQERTLRDLKSPGTWFIGEGENRINSSETGHLKVGEIAGSHGGEYEDGCLLGCCAV
jgi:hypothetical protein